jgi:aminopeptidase N
MTAHFEKLKDFIFEVTEKSMEFYEEFFGIEY